VAARSLQGLGSALLMPTSLSFVLAEFQKEKRAVAIAAWGAVGALAAAIGPALGSAIIHLLNWRWAFFLNIPIGIWCFIKSRKYLREAIVDSDSAVPRLLDVALCIASVALVSLAIVETKEWGWSSPSVLASAVAGIGIFSFFLIRNARSPLPIVDTTLFKSRNFVFANYSTFVFSAAFSSMFLSSVLFLKNIWQYNTVEVGLAMTVGPLCVIPTAIFTGKYAGRYGHARPLFIGGVLYCLAGMFRALTFDAEPSFLLLWLPAAVMSGMGVGMILPSLSSAATFDLLPNRYAAGSGVNNSIRQLGSVIGIALTVVCVGTETKEGLGSFTLLFWGLTVAGALTALLGVNVRTGQRSPAVKENS
jgi:MFS family permease